MITFRLDRRLIGFPHNAHGEGVQMSEKSYLDKLVGAWHTNLEADDYDEGVADELISEIRKTLLKPTKKSKKNPATTASSVEGSSGGLARIAGEMERRPGDALRSSHDSRKPRRYVPGFLL
jgi:hypothetical protein